ncbi:MAG: hypothetical protein ABEH78_09955 [Haloferacaceae archaeon]
MGGDGSGGPNRGDGAPGHGDGGHRRLAVEADLDVTVEGHRIHVAGYGDLVVVDAPSFAAVRALREGVDALPLPSVRAATGPANEGEPTVDVRVRGVSVARIGPGVDPGPLAALLGTAPARPSFGGVVRALLRR